LGLLEENNPTGQDYRSFRNILEELENAMDIIVNDYHESFNTVVRTFSGVVENIADSKRKAMEMKQNLQKCKDWLECKRFDLLHLWVKSMQYREMTRILDLAYFH
jgi:exocyst complex component 4